LEFGARINLFYSKCFQLFNWALEPADDAMLDKLFEWGYLDAAVWGEKNPVGLIVQEDIPLE